MVKVTKKHISSTVSESLETNEDFYIKLSSAWFNIQQGNNEFESNFSRLKRKISKSVVHHFISSNPNNKAFVMKVQLESVTIPLKISRIENDLTIYILSDFDLIAEEKTNIDGVNYQNIGGKNRLKARKRL